MNGHRNLLKILINSILAISSVLIMSCQLGWSQFFGRPDGVGSRSTNVVDINPPETVNGKSEYNVLIVTDVHFGAAGDDRVNSFFTWLDALSSADKPKFCMSLGDFAEHGYENEFQLYSSLLQKGLKDRGIPVYGIVGNHDLYNSGYNHWKVYVDPQIPYYRFSTQSFDWYFIDSANGTLGKPQLTDFLDKLDDNNRPKIVSTHYPVYGDDILYFSLSDTTERAMLLTAFANNNVKMVLCGHYHPGASYNFGPFTEYVTPGFHDYGKGAMLHINETNGTVSYEKVSF